MCPLSPSVGDWCVEERPRRGGRSRLALPSSPSRADKGALEGGGRGPDGVEGNADETCNLTC